MTSNEFPVLRQCKTLTASIKYNRLRIEVFRSAKYFSLSAFSGSAVKSTHACKLYLLSCQYVGGQRITFWKNRFYSSEQFSLFISKWIWFLVTVGLDNDLNTPLLSLLWASDIFCYRLLNQTGNGIAFRLTDNFLDWRVAESLFRLCHLDSSSVCGAFVQGILQCFAEWQHLVSRAQ